MKEIKAFIRSKRAKAVCTALRANGFYSMTLTEAEGTGLYTDPAEDFPTFKFPFMHSRVVKVEIVCPDAEMEAIIKIIRDKGKTGHAGDGIVYTLDVRQVYRIKNDHTGI